MEQSNITSLIKSKIIPQLEKSFKDNIYSVILYGSAARGRLNNSSDINLLILLKENNPESIINFGKSSARLIKKSRLTPLIMTEKEFLSSADVFPMEYNDLKDSYILITGDDPVPNLSLTDKNLRHQTESSLRGIINQMRQYSAASGGNSRYLSIALSKTLGSIESVMRGALRLKKKDVKNLSRKDIITAAAEAYGLNEESGLKMITADKNSITADLSQILSFLISLTEKIDKMEL